MAPAHEHQVVERRGAAIGPVLDVVRVASARAASREAAACIARVERPPEGGGNSARLPANVERGAVGSLTHHHDRGVARETPGRFRGNVDAAVTQFQRRLSAQVVCACALDVQHHLIAICGQALDPCWPAHIQPAGRRRRLFAARP